MDANDTWLNQQWLPGCRVQLNGNVADVIVGTHPTYHIDLALSETTVQSRI